MEDWIANKDRRYIPARKTERTGAPADVVHKAFQPGVTDNVEFGTRSAKRWRWRLLLALIQNQIDNIHGAAILPRFLMRGEGAKPLIGRRRPQRIARPGRNRDASAGVS
jgi:hypothetical protein